MERESAVREILQSIGPMFPEDAQRARAERRAGRQVEAAPAPADTPGEPGKIKMTPAPKPVLASQVEGPSMTRTRVADLAQVLEHLSASTPAASQTSVRDAVPELVRSPVPDVAALQAALDARADAKAAAATEPNVVVATKDVAGSDEPLPEVASPESAKPVFATTEPATFADLAVETPEQTLLVDAISEAIRAVTTPPTEEIPATAEEPEVVAPSDLEPPPVDVPAAPIPQKTFRRSKRDNDDEPLAAATAEQEPSPASVPVAPEPEPEPSDAAEEDELIRQIRTHRVDLLDVDEQLARLEAQIDADKTDMARYVAALGEKVAYRARLMRLRTATERFVTGLQARSEPRAAGRRGSKGAA